MKDTTYLQSIINPIIILSIILCIFGGCSLGADEVEVNPNETEIFKEILQTTVQSSAVGFGSVMATMIPQVESKK